MNLSQLVPKFTDRALLVGQTGSGKTVLAEYLLRYRRNVVVIDPKRRINWPGFKVYTSISALIKSKEPKRVYRPSHFAIKEWQDKDDEIERVFEWVYLRGSTTLYVDEAYLVTSGEEMPQFYHAALTQGRELEVETWSATQRPMNIPQVIMSEAEHLFAFRLKMPQDRKKVESMCGIDGAVVPLKTIPKYYFYYVPQDGEPVGPLTLDLASAK